MIKIVITRPEFRAKDTAELAQQVGFKPILFPLLQLSGLKDISLKISLSEYNWLLFTSSNAVTFFVEYCLQNEILISKKSKIAAVGPGTEKTLQDYGLKADFVPSIFNWTAISEQIPVIRGEIILYPTLLDGPNRIESLLSLRGCKVDRVDIYKSDPIIHSQKEWDELKSKTPDVFTFFSPRTVQAFFANKLKSLYPEKIVIAVLAKSSEEELHRFGLSAHITTNIPTAENLMQNIKEFYA